MGGRSDHQGRFAASAAECSSSQVRDERPDAEIDRASGPDQICHAQARQRRRKGLYERASQGGGSRRTRLGGDREVTRQPELCDLDEHFRVFLGKTKRRNDRATAEDAERALQKAAFLAEIGVEKGNERVDVLNHCNAETQVLFGPRQRRVGDIHIVNEDIFAPFRGDEGLAKAVDVFELVCEASRIVEICEC